MARLFRRVYTTSLGFLPVLHTIDEDRVYFRERVFSACEVWVADVGGTIVGFCAIRRDWIDQLHVDPAHQRRGIGSALLAQAKEGRDALQLWTFQKNANAIRFYEARGFTLAERTDGRRNEEREPDARYRWSRAIRLDLT